MSGCVLAASLLAMALGLAYGPDVGHGLIKDDFRWIATTRIDLPVGAAGLLRHDVGFYRPVVAATFAIDYLAFGLDPLWYGLTNFALLGAAAALLLAVGLKLGLPPECALVAAGVWVFNLRGINMALLWRFSIITKRSPTSKLWLRTRRRTDRQRRP